MKAGVVYLITCLSCGEEYVGETRRPVCVRITEHLDGLAKGRSSTPLSAHSRLCHENATFDTAVTILSHEPQTIARKTLEAFWIASRNPKINRKEECVAVTNELAPFQTLYGF